MYSQSYHVQEQLVKQHIQSRMDDATHHRFASLAHQKKADKGLTFRLDWSFLTHSLQGINHLFSTNPLQGNATP